jgi:hypothetical protein
MKKLILYIIITIFSVGELFANTTEKEYPSTQGSEFYFSIMRARNARAKDLTLLVSTQENGVIRLTNPRTGTTHDYPITASQVTVIPLMSVTKTNSTENSGIVTATGSHTDSYTIIANSAQDKGYFIQAFKTGGDPTNESDRIKVSIYASMAAESSFDVANVLPIEALGNEYYVISRSGNNTGGDSAPYWPSEAMIVATEDNTVIEITPTSELGPNTAGTNPQGDILGTFEVTLQRGQTYLITANSGSRVGADDLTGTRIKVKDDGNAGGNKCKKIAVFSGNQHGGGDNSQNRDTDYEFEQLFPTHLWGTNFMVASTIIDGPYAEYPDLVRIVAAKPCTELHLTGKFYVGTRNEVVNGTAPLVTDTVVTINQTGYYDVRLADKTDAVFIKSSQKVQVGLMPTRRKDDNDGSPSLITIAPIEQYLNKITFAAAKGPSLNAHFVLITSLTSICQKTKLNNIELSDANNLANTNYSIFDTKGATWTLTSNPLYSFIKLQIYTDINYTLENIENPTKGGFNAYVYGDGNTIGYGYSVGSAARPMELSFTATDVATGYKVDNEEMSNLDVCMGGELLFEIDVPQSFEKIEWNFGDGEFATTTGNTVTHRYATDGIYDITINVYKTDIECYMENLNLVEEITSQIRIKKEVKTSYAATDYCFGETLTSQRTSNFTSSEVAYKWSTNATTESITLTSPIADYGSSIKVWVATYSTDITSPNYCTSYIDTFYVNIRPIQTAAPIVLSPQCKGTTIASTRTSADFGGNTPTYLWSTGETTKTITLADDYGVTKKYWVLSKYNCAIADTFVVNIINEVTNQITTAPPHVCEGTAVTLQATQSGPVNSYGWFIGATSIANGTLSVNESPSTTTTYTFKSVGDCQTLSKDIEVKVNPQIVGLLLTADPPNPQPGQSVTLTASTSSIGNYIYTWSNNVNNPNSTGNVNTDNPSEGNKTYIVTAKDVDELCSAIDDVAISVGKLPTVITPYTLGANDEFSPGYDCIIFVFNRIGQKIFEGNNIWDGTNTFAGGRKADPGVYYYIIADKNTRKALVKGTIEVVKKN